MRIGIGLPAAVPGTPATAIGDWAAAGEQQGFESLAVLDRLVYDNLDPLVALAAAADRTERVELLTPSWASRFATARWCWPSSSLPSISSRAVA
jgi:alkanesulfonate monooxygenase SsuD/methylene tetrahydromethanopterin reductase-like flavin-dependent oxidoreductase (luciferase family)